jgi:hypothetical protein
MSDEMSKEDYIVNYIKSIATLEEAMLPFKEQRKDLRKSYVDNGWLDKDDVKLALRAYRLMKQDVDFDELRQAYRTIKQQKNIIGILSDDEENE